MDELYRDQILEHYKRPHNFGRLDDFDLEHEDTNPLCGDEQHVYIKLDDEGRVSEVSFEGQGCAISTAATSLLTDELAGMTREELLRIPKEEVLDLLGIEISATRMKCAMLGVKVRQVGGARRACRLGGRGRAGRSGGCGDGLSRPPAGRLSSDSGSRPGTGWRWEPRFAPSWISVRRALSPRASSRSEAQPYLVMTMPRVPNSGSPAVAAKTTAQV